MTKSKRLEKIRQAVFKVAAWVAPRWVGKYLARLFLTPKRYDRPGWEQLLLAKAEKINLTSGRKAWRWGQGPAVLLVHGWEGRGSQLGAFVDPLLAAGYQVIAWDGPAHGDSPGRTTHLADFARALIDDCKQFPPLEAVVAHSMGGAALVLALEWGLKIKKAVLIAAPSQWAGAFRAAAKRYDLNARVARAALASIERRVGGTLESFDVKYWELKFRPQIFIVHDEKDNDVPIAEFDRLKQKFSQAKTKLSSGLGHRRILKDATLIFEIVCFLKEVA